MQSELQMGLLNKLQIHHKMVQHYVVSGSNLAHKMKCSELSSFCGLSFTFKPDSELGQ